MAIVSRSFEIDEPPQEAQAHFRGEIGQALRDKGFKLRDEMPGHLGFGVQFLIHPGWIWLWGWLTVPYWLWRRLSGQKIEVDFTATNGSCKVEIYGRTSRRVSDAINLLGRIGHWPSNVDDPDWIIPVSKAPAEDPYREWDELDEPVDPQDLDRITKRALKKAGRLKS